MVFPFGNGRPSRSSWFTLRMRFKLMRLASMTCSLSRPTGLITRLLVPMTTAKPQRVEACLHIPVWCGHVWPRVPSAILFERLLQSWLWLWIFAKRIVGFKRREMRRCLVLCLATVLGAYPWSSIQMTLYWIPEIGSMLQSGLAMEWLILTRFITENLWTRRRWVALQPSPRLWGRDHVAAVSASIN